MSHPFVPHTERLRLAAHGGSSSQSAVVNESCGKMKLFTRLAESGMMGNPAARRREMKAGNELQSCSYVSKFIFLSQPNSASSPCLRDAAGASATLRPCRRNLTLL